MDERKRHIAILKDHKGDDFKHILLENLIRAEIPNASLYVFSIDKDAQSDLKSFGDVKVISFPDECDNEAKRHNFISRYFKVENVTSGMLYVIRDNVEIFPGKFSNFIPKIEDFMDFFGYRVWLNTVCDECNYIFDKFVSRISIKMDKPELEGIWKDDVIFTTNANLDITAFDLDRADISEMLFDESFSVAMFVIIKFLAERRNKGIPGCFMNLYPTIPAEKGMAKKHNEIKEDKVSKSQFDAEMKAFGELGINNEPTFNVNDGIDFIIKKILGE